MDTRELKFVLNLLGAPNYRAPISQVKPNNRTKAAERDSICRALRDRGIVDCSEEIVECRIAPPGSALLRLDTSRLPVTEDEIIVLQACADTSILTKDLDLPSDRRQVVLQKLAERGLIKAEATRIEDVWLTNFGLDYLHDDYSPKGSGLELSLDHLNCYLQFLRKRDGGVPIAPSPDHKQPVQTPVNPQRRLTEKPNDADIWYVIEELDRQLDTHNYLPIFYLRERLQPPLTRAELDSALYRLQREDRLELSSLQEAAHYTPEEVEAGIPQDIGGPLFFLIRN
ncbi:hypothetical protein E1H12_06570 [Geitlerinema sp. P-1104]|uniref:hypothetical protein n=1 Tax=Geitlerinema sp. P-1104 TaxID=2546230 RepID=UPI001476D89D|nr:hypothetical protein [Geitlerinema sp. P-1104]NMG58197.1 hypothetical protein [Geitlerinema sp. P-1104]